MPSGKCQITGKFYASLDEHHIVPREYGGESGPTIMLGPDIHSMIHRSTNASIKEQFLSSLPMTQRQKVSYLLESIEAAKRLRKKVVGPRKVTLKIDEKTYQKLKDLGKI